MRYCKWISILFVVFSLLPSVGSFAGSASTTCPYPKPNLQMGGTNNNTIGQPILFTFRNHSYPMDIYSAYATQGIGPDSSICLRFEAVNKSEDSIEMFFWPAAAGFQSKKIGSQQRVKILSAIPNGTAPIAKESWLYAFLNSAAKGKAYQQLSSLSAIPIRSTASTEPGNLIQKVQFSTQKRAFDKPSSLPSIGTEYSISDDQVEAFSNAAWDGKTLTVNISINRSNDKFAPKIIAPYTYALLKGPPKEAILSLVRDFRNAALPIAENTINAKSTFQLNSSEPALYIIQQPITIYSPEGSTCFLAPTYSPIPIPTDFMACNLIRE